MLSHQPDVRRLLQQERVAALAASAQRPLPRLRLSPPERPQRQSQLAVFAQAALNVRHRRLPSRS